MGTDRLAAAVPEGEALRYRTGVRAADALGLTDERLLLVDGDGTVTSVEYGNVEEVTAQDVDWFVGVLSAGLVVFGALSVTRNVFLSAGFVLAGLASGYLVYRKRGEVRVQVRDRAKPISFYVDDTDEFLSRLESRLDGYGGRRSDDDTDGTDGIDASDGIDVSDGTDASEGIDTSDGTEAREGGSRR